jgi:hypothetical protein
MTAWSARCDCYAGHNSASGRCNVRNVTASHSDATRPVLCERCERECRRPAPPTLYVAIPFEETAR